MSEKVAYLKGKRPVKTGNIARLTRFYENLNPLSSILFKGLSVNFQNPFHNNLAQVVELMHFLEESEKVLPRLLKEDIDGGSDRRKGF